MVATRDWIFSLSLTPHASSNITLHIVMRSSSASDLKQPNCAFRLATDVVPYAQLDYSTPFELVFTSAMLSVDVVANCRGETQSNPAQLTISNDDTDMLYDRFESGSFRVRGALWLEDAALDRNPTVPNSTAITLQRVPVMAVHAVRFRLAPMLAEPAAFVFSTVVDSDCSLSVENITTSLFSSVLSATFPAGTSETIIFLYCARTLAQMSLTVTVANASSPAFYAGYTTNPFTVESRFNMPTLPAAVHVQEPNKLTVSFLPVDALNVISRTVRVAITVDSMFTDCYAAPLNTATGGVPDAATWVRLATAAMEMTVKSALSFDFWFKCLKYTHVNNGSQVADSVVPRIVIKRLTGTAFMQYMSPEVQISLIDCLPLAAITNGTALYTDKGFGLTNYKAEVAVTCQDGYALQATATAGTSCVTNTALSPPVTICTQTLTCLATGWSAPAPSCGVYSCPAVPAAFPTFGTAPVLVAAAPAGGATGFGAKYSYGCISGFTLNGATETITCTAGGWSSPSAPACGAVECPLLALSNNIGAITYSKLPYGALKYLSVATLECMPLYERTSGDAKLTCQANRTWSGTPAICRSNTCVRIYPDTATMKAITFMRYGAPVVPDAASLTYAIDSVAQYACADGYVWEDTAAATARTCVIAQGWLPADPPRCVPRACPTLGTATLGSITQLPAALANLYGVTATYACDYGAVMDSNDPKIMCTTSGQWSSAARTCKPYNCGAPGGIIAGSVAIANNGTHGAYGVYYNYSVVEYRCNVGYNMRYVGYSLNDGSGVMLQVTQSGATVLAARRECTPRGWTPVSLPICDVNQCVALSVPTNGLSVTYEDTLGTSNNGLIPRSYGTTATYACKVGYEARDAVTDVLTSAKRKCGTLADGWLPAVAPVCNSIDCGSLDDAINNALPVTYTYNETTMAGPTRYQATAEYRCKAGFMLSTGADVYMRTCTSVRTWAPAVPLCVDVDECDAQAWGGKYFVDCAALYGSRSRCINTYGSYVCTPYVLASPAPENVISTAGSVTYMPATTEIVPDNARGGQIVRFTLQAGANVPAPYISRVQYSNSNTTLYADAAALLTYECEDAVATPSTAAPGYLLVQCTLVPGQGTDLFVAMQFCTQPTLGGAVNCSEWNWAWSGGSSMSDAASIGSNNGVRVSYPMHYFVPASLHSITVAGPGQRTSDYVSITTLGENIGFDVENLFLDRAGLVKMSYGLATTVDDYPFDCAFNQAASQGYSSVQRTIVCHTKDAINEIDLKFRLTIAGRHAYGTDRYSYPQKPIVDSVYGCKTDDVLAGTTSDCPTDSGNVRITVSGSGFLEPLTAMISGRQCTGIERVTNYAFTCSLPIGTGTGLSLIVKAGSQRTESRGRVTYASPTITEIRGCQMLSKTEIADCSRLGGDRIMLRGTNFGVSGATVSIGGLTCFNVTHTATDPHREVLCTTPADATVDRAVTLLQRYGSLSQETILVSYVQCPPGQHTLDVACVACESGNFNDMWSQTACRSCQPGTYSADPGATVCSVCPVGTYSGLGASECTRCPRGTFSQERAESCYQCAPGTFAEHEGSAQCEACPLGAEHTSDYSYCQCKVGSFMDTAGVCRTCMLGGDCSQAGVSVYNVHSLRSYSPSVSFRVSPLVIRLHLPVAVAVSAASASAMSADDFHRAAQTLALKALFDGTKRPRGRFTVVSVETVASAATLVELSRECTDAAGDSSSSSSSSSSSITTKKSFSSTAVRVNMTTYHLVTVDIVPIPTTTSSSRSVTTTQRGNSLDLAQPSFHTSGAYDNDLTEYAYDDAALSISGTRSSTNSGRTDNEDTATSESLAESVLSTYNSANLALSAATAYVAPAFRNTTYHRRAVTSFEACLENTCVSGDACVEGHTGPLCTVCLPGYGKTSAFKCGRCNEPALAWFILIAGTIAAILVCAMLAWKQIVDGRESMNELPAPAVPLLFKIATSGLQVMSIASRYDLKWPGFLGGLFDSADTAAGVGTAMVSLDCFLGDDPAVNPFWVTSIGIMLLPILGILLPIIFFAPRYYTAKRAYRKHALAELRKQRRVLVEMVTDYEAFIRGRERAAAAVRRADEQTAAENDLRAVIWDGVDDAADGGVLAAKGADFRALALQHVATVDMDLDLETKERRTAATIAAEVAAATAAAKKKRADAKFEGKKRRNARRTLMLRANSAHTDASAGHGRAAGAQLTDVSATATKATVSGGPLAPPGLPPVPAASNAAAAAVASGSGLPTVVITDPAGVENNHGSRNSSPTADARGSPMFGSVNNSVNSTANAVAARMRARLNVSPGCSGNSAANSPSRSPRNNSGAAGNAFFNSGPAAPVNVVHSGPSIAAGARSSLAVLAFVSGSASAVSVSPSYSPSHSPLQSPAHSRNARTAPCGPAPGGAAAACAVPASRRRPVRPLLLPGSGGASSNNFSNSNSTSGFVSVGFHQRSQSLSPMAASGTTANARALAVSGPPSPSSSSTEGDASGVESVSHSQAQSRSQSPSHSRSSSSASPLSVSASSGSTALHPGHLDHNSRVFGAAAAAAAGNAVGVVTAPVVHFDHNCAVDSESNGTGTSDSNSDMSDIDHSAGSSSSDATAKAMFTASAEDDALRVLYSNANASAACSLSSARAGDTRHISVQKVRIRVGSHTRSGGDLSEVDRDAAVFGGAHGSGLHGKLVKRSAPKSGKSRHHAPSDSNSFSQPSSPRTLSSHSHTHSTTRDDDSDHNIGSDSDTAVAHRNANTKRFGFVTDTLAFGNNCPVNGDAFALDDSAFMFQKAFLEDLRVSEAALASAFSNGASANANSKEALFEHTAREVALYAAAAGQTWDGAASQAASDRACARAASMPEMAVIAQSADDLENMKLLSTVPFETFYRAEELRERVLGRERAVQSARSERQREWYTATYGKREGEKVFEREREKRLRAEPPKLMASEVRVRLDVAETQYNNVASEFSGYVITAITVVMFMIHPNITRQFFTVLSCKNVGGTDDPTANVVLGDMLELCYSSQHLLFILALGVPMLLLWVLGIPFFAWIVLYRNRDLVTMPAQGASAVMRNQKRIFESQMAFLYRGYKPTRYYWFLTEMARKAALVAIAVFFPGALHTQLMLASLLIFMCIIAQIVAKPFENRIPEVVELISLFTSFMVFFLANFLFVETVSDAAMVVITVLICALVIAFIAIVVFAFFVLSKQEADLTPLRTALRLAHAQGTSSSAVIRDWRIAAARKRREELEAKTLAMIDAQMADAVDVDSDSHSDIDIGTRSKSDRSRKAKGKAYHAAAVAAANKALFGNAAFAEYNGDGAGATSAGLSAAAAAAKSQEHSWFDLSDPANKAKRGGKQTPGSGSGSSVGVDRSEASSGGAGGLAGLRAIREEAVETAEHAALSALDASTNDTRRGLLLATRVDGGGDITTGLTHAGQSTHDGVDVEGDGGNGSAANARCAAAMTAVEHEAASAAAAAAFITSARERAALLAQSAHGLALDLDLMPPPAAVGDNHGGVGDALNGGKKWAHEDAFGE